MPFDSYGAPQFGLEDCKVAQWIATNSYGAAVDVPSIQMMGVTLNQVTAELTGDDEITATASRSIGAEVRIRFGGVSLAALEVLLGIDTTTQNAEPAEVKQLKITGGNRMPYFGIVGKALAEEGAGAFMVFLPKVKVTSDVVLASLEYGAWAIPEVTARGVADATYGIVNLIELQEDAAVQIPPDNIV